MAPTLHVNTMWVASCILCFPGRFGTLFALKLGDLKGTAVF